jgi:hypothetical protein
MVGRLHYSLGSTLSAQFRWSFCASERSYCYFLVLGYYEVPGLYGAATKPVNTAPYLSLQGIEWWRLNTELLADDARVVGVLLGCGRVGAACTIKPQ